MSKLSVLVIEDDDFQRQTLLSMLDILGVGTLHSAANGQQALDILRAAGPGDIHIAICDLNMPGMDGMEFLRHVGRENHKVAIVISSAQERKLLSSVAKMARLYGIRLLGVLEKPIILTSLREALARHEVAEKKWAAPAEHSQFGLDEILAGIRNRQFEPYFQPKVDLHTGRLTGAEALARWAHPEFGVVGPAAFIARLEESGAIDALTFCMLEKSALACRLFHERGHVFTISVNLSLTSLADPSLADRIIALVRGEDIDPHYIVLEITESAAMTDVPQALENLARLCMNGFTLSIDDYGTGYSSLQQLSRIAFSELKIDQSFVKDFTENDALRIIVESSIDMSHKLQFKCVAEGVESQEEWDLLKELGCDVVQGYFIAQPMEFNAFCDFVSRYRAAAAPAPASAPDTHDIRILVLDGDRFARKIAARVLHDLGYQKTTEAESVETALKLLASDTFDLIITDISLAGKNGIEFIQMIRTGKTLASPDSRIIIMTLLSRSEILGAALALDINGFIVKPIVPAVLDEKITYAMTERFKARPILAYEAVASELKTVPGHHPPSAAEAPKVNASISMSHAENSGSAAPHAEELPLRRLRPGMIVRENIRLNNGTLILSVGQTLTELAIHRLADVENVLDKKNFLVEIPPEKAE